MNCIYLSSTSEAKLVDAGAVHGKRWLEGKGWVLEEWRPHDPRLGARCGTAMMKQGNLLNELSREVGNSIQAWRALYNVSYTI